MCAKVVVPAGRVRPQRRVQPRLLPEHLAHPKGLRRSKMGDAGAPVGVLALAHGRPVARDEFANAPGDQRPIVLPGLRGVIATAATVEGCRTELAEGIEAWLLVPVARVPVPDSEGAR